MNGRNQETGKWEKRKVYIKTFIGTSPSQIDKEVNTYRENHEVIAIQTNIAIGHNTNLPLFHYVVFYKEPLKKA